MELETSKNYEELASEWQYQMILLLKDTLKKYGVEGKQAKDIAGDFAFAFAMLHDQGAIRFDRKSYEPRITFDDFDGKLFIDNGYGALHEFAYGNTRKAFGDV